MNQKDIVLILFSSFILTVIWISLSIYGSAVTSTITATQGMQIAEIAPNFDPEALSAIKARTVIAPLFEAQVPPQDVSPTPEVVVEPIADTQPLETTVEETFEEIPPVDQEPLLFDTPPVEENTSEEVPTL